MKIERVLAQRTDLSTFLVHLSKTTETRSAKDCLKAILTERQIKAFSAFGAAVSMLEEESDEVASQKCVCFSETPLEHVSHLTGEIEDRTFEFEPYGVGVTKRQGRANGINPVWYIDITPGYDWLTNPVNALIQEAIDENRFIGSPISRLTPFFEQMGTGRRLSGGTYRKEFWWEREWRSAGDFTLPSKFLVFCPEEDFAEISRHVEQQGLTGNCEILDPFWSLEKMIAHLAGFAATDAGGV